MIQLLDSRSTKISNACKDEIIFTSIFQTGTFFINICNVLVAFTISITGL